MYTINRERMLRKVFQSFSDFTLSSKELVDYLKKQEEYTENGSRTRVSQSRRIINSGHSKQVLEICNSSRIPEENNYSCLKLFHSYMGKLFLVLLIAVQSNESICNNCARMYWLHLFIRLIIVRYE